MHLLLKYLRYIPSSRTSIPGWFLMVFGTLTCGVLGFYSGPVKISELTYEARIVKAGMEHGRGVSSSRSVGIYIQADRKRLEFFYPEANPNFGDAVRALNVIRRDEKVTVHSISSNYYRERMWKLEHPKAGVVLSENHDELLREVSKRSAENVVGAKERTRNLLVASFIFLIVEIIGFRRHPGERVIGDSIVYKASKDFYRYLAAISVFMLGMMIYLGWVMIESPVKRAGMEPFLAIPVVGAFSFVALVWYCLRLARGVKHNLTLTREGLHYRELFRKYDVEFIPWSNMHFCVFVEGGFYLYLRNPLHGLPENKVIYFDTYALSGPGNVITDIEQGIYGKLFPDKAPS